MRQDVDEKERDVEEKVGVVRMVKKECCRGTAVSGGSTRIGKKSSVRKMVDTGQSVVRK